MAFVKAAPSISLHGLHNGGVVGKGRKGWTVKVGSIDELKREQLDVIRNMDPNERVAMVQELRRLYLGDDEQRLERTYRLLTRDRG